MRGKYNWAVGVREPDGGVYEESHDLASGQSKNGWMYWPLRARLPRAWWNRWCWATRRWKSPRSMRSTRMRKTRPIQLLRNGRRRPAPTEWLQRLRLASLREPRNAMVGVGAASLHPLAGDADACSAAHPNACDPDGEAPVPGPANATFSWKDDFGRPDTVIDALGAQRSLEVVSASASADGIPAAAASEPAGEVRRRCGVRQEGNGILHGAGPGHGRGAVHRGAGVHHEPAGGRVRCATRWPGTSWMAFCAVAVFVFYLWLIGRMERYQAHVRLSRRRA